MILFPKKVEYPFKIPYKQQQCNSLASKSFKLATDSILGCSQSVQDDYAAFYDALL